MDASRCSQSELVTLDTIKHPRVVGEEPTPLVIATLLFEEASDHGESGLIHHLADGRDTGVGIQGGERTVPYRQLGIPAGMTAVHVAKTHVSYGEPPFESRHGVAVEQWGILLLAREHSGSAHWLWSIIWTPSGHRDPVCQELSVDQLAQLMSADGGREPVLNRSYVYSDYLAMATRKLRAYRESGDWFGDKVEEIKRRRAVMYQLDPSSIKFSTKV